MKEPRIHQPIIDHYERCLATHGEGPRAVDWPDAEDAALRYDVMLGLLAGDRAPDRPGKAELLDFGCGTGDLLAHMRETGTGRIGYTGLDASEAFVEAARRRFPEAEFRCADILAEPLPAGAFDYAVLNGVFTERVSLSNAEMFDYMGSVLAALFPACRRGLAFNVMSKQVDWERDDLFHLPVDTLLAFLAGALSRHVVIRHDYGLYEYTAYVYRHPQTGTP